MADKESEDWYKDVREKQIKRGSASKDDKDLLALADKLLGGNSQMLVKYNSFPEYEVLKDGKTYRINPETNTAEEIKSDDKLDYEVVNDFAIDAIKDNFTPPGAKDEEDDYNPQSEVRYTSPEELKLSEMSEEDLRQGLEDIKRGVTDYTDAEEPVVTGWIKDEMAKRKSKPTDEMADFQKSLDDYASKNKKGRDDIPVTTRR